MPEQVSTQVAQTARACTDPAILCWMEAHPGMASWAQFVGAMLALVVALLAAWLPRYFAKLDQRASARRARPQLSEVMFASQKASLSVLQCALKSPSDIGSIALDGVILDFERVAWSDLTDRDYNLGISARRCFRDFESEKRRVEKISPDTAEYYARLNVLKSQHDLLHKLYMTLMETGDGRRGWAPFKRRRGG